MDIPILDSDGALISIQKSAVNVLRADPYFENRIILPEYPGDIDTMIDDTLGARGFCLVVATPAGKAIKRNLPMPYLQIHLVVLAFEQVMLNQNDAGPRSEDALEVASCILHNYTRDGIHQAITANEDFLNPVQRGNRYGKAINFTVLAGLGRVKDPVITDDGSGNITITNRTVGGSTYYTTDGTSPDMTNSLRYGSPFAIGSGVTVKARTLLAGKLSSTVASYTRP